MTYHARNTLTKGDSSPLSLVPRTQKVSDPYSKVENWKLHKAHHMVIRKLLTRTYMSYSQYSTINILKITDEKQNGRDFRPFSRKYFKKVL